MLCLKIWGEMNKKNIFHCKNYQIQIVFLLNWKIRCVCLQILKKSCNFFLQDFLMVYTKG